MILSFLIDHGKVVPEFLLKRPTEYFALGMHRNCVIIVDR